MRIARLFLLLALFLGGLLTPTPGARAATGWTPGTALGTARVYHTATLLLDGTVLVAGGYTTSWAPLATVERYDPATGAWSPVAAMNFGRLRHAAALLPDGRVLVVGGQTYPDAGSATAEVYDPATNTWTLIAPMLGPRDWPTATTLRDGRVLVVDGAASTPRPLSSGTAELYDPATGRWTPAGTLATERFAHTATLLPDGTVLVVGGRVPSHSPRCGSSRAFCATAAAERYDPATNVWVEVASAASPHGLGHTATLLPDGQVLVVGGSLSEQTAERYDPRTDRWTAAGTPPGTQFVREAHTATLLADGSVLVAGGGQVTSTATTAIYDATSDSWRAGPTLATGRNRHTATRLRDGRVLVTGGGGSAQEVAFNSTELYATDAPAACFTETGYCVQGRFLARWEANGGLARNGYPLSDERVEVLEDGKTYTVQYFERVRLEYHPQNPAPYDVLLGQFGRRVLLSRRPTGLISAPAEPIPGQTYFPETRHNLAPDFLAYWQANGGLAQFGFPLTEEFTEMLEDGRDYTVQYFERARFERHPENPTPYTILLGQFGRQVLSENALVAEPFRYWFVALQPDRTPLGPATVTSASYQTFERGAMLYRADTRTISIFPAGEGQAFSCYSVPDTWDSSQPVGGGPGPAPGLYEPQRGFGNAWDDRARLLLGYATTPDETGYTMTTQAFRVPGARALTLNLFSRPDGVSAHGIISGGSSAPSCSQIALR